MPILRILRRSFQLSFDTQTFILRFLIKHLISKTWYLQKHSAFSHGSLPVRTPRSHVNRAVKHLLLAAAALSDELAKAISRVSVNRCTREVR